MDQDGKENGYVIQFYQYARRYSYNNEGCLRFFNDTLDRREKLGTEAYTLYSDFLVFGEFDLLQVISVENFREYHDVSELAKDWLGKRQSVLLYEISEDKLPVRICYDESNRLWKRRMANGDTKEIETVFFCFSMVSLTNEIVEKTGDISGLLKVLRAKILSIVDKLNSSKDLNISKLECEVFGTLNPSELGIVWLSDQYVDVLQLMDYIKHIKISECSKAVNQNAEDCQAFLTSFSIISIKEETKEEAKEKKVFQDVRGSALVQVAMHDSMKDYVQIMNFAEQIVKNGSGKILGSVGEYDLVIRVSARRAIKLIRNGGLLCVGKRERKTGKFEIESPKILRNNTKLLYDEADTQDLRDFLNGMYKEGDFSIAWPKQFQKFKHQFEWEELKWSGDLLQNSGDEKSNADYFRMVRQKLKRNISSSAGAVDTLDLLYADYQSTISSAYSAMWVSDLHRQFKAVLYAIHLLLTPNDLKWSWNDYRDLTNAFKQQIYHLAQSSKMFLEIPSCHLRATGQYDFLMHAYFGVTKKILETIYLIQGVDAQSELVPLITVNTVPQVRTQMYFECGEDDRRVVNLDIPNSIIFDFQRGIWYLTHELFHYAVPQKRAARNYYMAVFLLSLILKKQVFWMFQEILSVDVDGLTDEENKKTVVHLLKGEEIEDEIEDEKAQEAVAEIYNIVNKCVRKYILCHFEKVEAYIKTKSKVNDLSNNYQRALYEFVESNDSDEFFQELFGKMCKPVFEILLHVNHIGGSYDIEYFHDRIRYCKNNDGYVQQFIKENSTKRKFDSELKTHIRLTREHAWAAVREACSDIAMISFNGLDIVDYMIFCIQAWTDENNDKSQVLSLMNQDSEVKERIRYSLVAEFIHPCSMGKDNSKDISKIEKEFCKRYVWFYVGKSVKQPKENQYEDVKRRFETKYKEAQNWLNYLKECRRMYLKDYSWYYEGILDKLLSDYDIGKRIEMLEEQEADGNDICQLKSILKEFKAKVYLPYFELNHLIPDEFEGFFEKAGLENIKECDKRYNAARFKQDIAVANHFQNQRSLQELWRLNQEIRKKCEKYTWSLPELKVNIPNMSSLEKKDVPCWKFHVHSLRELLFYIQFCYDQLEKTAKDHKYIMGQRKNPKIWFRGHSSEEYTHVPIAMRNFKGDRMKNYRSLRDYQQSNFEEFKFRADGAAEMSAGQQFTQSDYIAMMQHYGAPTNFLDWTENAFTSLYLALKYHYEDMKKEDSKYRNVTLSIFHPGIYNRVRWDSLEDIWGDLDKIYAKTEKIKWLQEILKSFGIATGFESKYANLIPNLSIKENEDRYDMFLLGDIKTEKYLDEMRNRKLKALNEIEKSFRQKYNQAYRTDLKALFMPMAVLTSRLNPRIRTQCGCFVAYNLYTPPNLEVESDKDNKKSLFEYVSLEAIQEEKKEKAIFMYQIVIDKECCAEVVKWLRTLGVSRENVYPELSEKGYYFD